MARANNLKNSGVPDDIFQLDDLSVLVHDHLMQSFTPLYFTDYFYSPLTRPENKLQLTAGVL